MLPDRLCATKDSKRRDDPPDTSTRPEQFASALALASASASGKGGLSVPAAGRAVEPADGGELPRVAATPSGSFEIFRGGIRAGEAAVQADDRHARQVPSETCACVAQ